ncbi:Wadjet anti-phage system protein JetD domain-containing protein [Konateibacter massiliensis]|uniref:Wadjet anti-phage system protein JetD domain-containing protein n=1 Tax=Konateibacter massiliensis TaxID=2002841 RepID=UPI0015D4D768|nr:Wadjet anti-phage system protein JetD domain-containing protein [Konateibacter massiliensis]
MSTWSKPDDIKRKIDYRWKKGDILRHCLLKDDLFPLVIKLDAPSYKELSLYFSNVIIWITQLKEKEKLKRGYGYELIEKEINYRTIGKNSIPTHAQISSLEDAIKILHKQREVELFISNTHNLLQRWKGLQEWILRYPFKLIKSIGNDCDKFITVLEWFETHPNHYLYLRQLDIPSIDTKFIENNKTVIGELLEILLPTEQVNMSAKNFEEKFYLRQKPKMIRFRILDSRYTWQGISDLTVPIEEFSQWRPGFEKIFFTENEINFLSFPKVENSCIIFGKGYGVEIFKMAKWIADKKIYYWGDIDTHGFNILSIARGFLPNLKSFLMTEEILLEHREMWVNEEKQHLSEIENLTYEESILVSKLQNDYFGKGIRLEQERVAFGFVEKFIENLIKFN